LNSQKILGEGLRKDRKIAPFFDFPEYVYPENDIDIFFFFLLEKNGR
jgi:hypothetical protein